jgi:hypothetical protein
MGMVQSPGLPKPEGGHPISLEKVVTFSTERYGTPGPPFMDYYGFAIPGMRYLPPLSVVMFLTFLAA